MKRLSCFTLAILFLVGLPCSTGHAEDQTSPSLDLGVKGAYARVTFFRGGNVQGVNDLKYKDGLAFGLFSHYRFYAVKGLRFGVQPELLFVRRGAVAEYEGLTVGTFQLNYLELPVLGRALFALSHSIEPYVVLGPRLGFLLSAENIDFNGNARDESDGTNTFDVGFSVGAGALIHVGSRMMLTIEGRYDQSLMNRLDLDGGEVTNDQRHRAFFLMLGVSMGIGSPSRPSGP